MKKFITWKLLAILVVTLALGFFDLPAEKQKSILPFSFESRMRLGLDLQGGSQLDYKIDLRKVPELDRDDIVDGVQEVIERRVNRLGVSEPNIYRSEIAEETHIIVELAETGTLNQDDVDNYLGAEKSIADLTDDEKKLVSLEKAKATVGKTIQLEFKEERSEPNTDNSEETKGLAQNALDRINGGEDFTVVSQEETLAYPSKIKLEKSDFVFENELPENIKAALGGLEVGQHSEELVGMGGTFIVSDDGSFIEETGVTILKLYDTREEVRTEKEVDTSHILIAHDETESDATRSKKEAKALAEEIKEKIEGGESFDELAKEFSDDSTNNEIGGILDTPVSGAGTYVFDYEEAAMALASVGDLSDLVETQFGFHLIKANAIRENIAETQYKYESLSYSTQPDPWQETGLTGEHFLHADVQLDNLYQSYISIQLNKEGADLFKEITENNMGKRVGIFVGGELVTDPVVQQVIPDGSAQITGRFTNEEAATIARDLNTGAIPAPIVLTGEYTIGATLGQQALTTSLNAGAIGIIIVILFMLAYYRLPGLVAGAALLIYGITLIFLLKAELHLGVALGLALVAFGFLTTKIINNKDSGWEKFLSFILACFGFFFLTFLLKTSVVLTLAGVAGIILSLGMAVDANILIFERIKEELRDGKKLDAAIQDGFERAWSAIRDSNFSTLLTCAILFYFGSSIIRGFAFNLAAGVLVSMFTAITITRVLLCSFIGTKIGESLKAFSVKKDKAPKKINFIKKTKLWFSLSGIALVVAIFGMFGLGLNLGIDFSGGTLLEFKFEEQIEKETLGNTLIEIEGELNANKTGETVETTESPVLSSNSESLVDLTHVQILESGETSFIVKTKYLTSEDHDSLIEKMRGKLPKFTEPRFTTIGPVIGSTLLHKAMIAIIFALIMIIIYVAIAFRKVPKEVSPWRFGAVAIVALLHDVLIVTGIFVILSQFMDVEINALFITAMLTVFGYSVNDTIVVLDRLRENLIRHDNLSLEDNANNALSQTLARSINTSLSTLITLVAVLIFGSPTIFFFVLALALGTAVGTYSSIFIATPLLVAWNKRKR